MDITANTLEKAITSQRGREVAAAAFDELGITPAVPGDQRKAILAGGRQQQRTAAALELATQKAAAASRPGRRAARLAKLASRAEQWAEKYPAKNRAQRRALVDSARLPGSVRAQPLSRREVVDLFAYRAQEERAEAAKLAAAKEQLKAGLLAKLAEKRAERRTEASERDAS